MIWEIRIKEAIGKLELPAEFRSVLDEQPFLHLPVTVEHAHAVAELPPIHRDPFDRMLAAQARSERMVVATRDAVFAEYGVGVIAA